jgi:hypothetical protein
MYAPPAMAVWAGRPKQELGLRESPMKVCIAVLKVSGYIWLTAAVLLILAGIAGTWMKDGFSGVQDLLSPFNVVNWIVTVITLAPGLGALAWAEKLKAKSPITQ